MLVPLGLPANAQAATPAITTSFFTLTNSTNTDTKTTLFRDGAGSLGVEGYPTGFTITAGNATDDSSSYRLMFTAPSGHAFDVGSYGGGNFGYGVNPNIGTINVYGDALCSAAGARFQILDITPDLSRLWLFYEVQCYGSENRVLNGELRYHEPVQDPDVLVAADRLVFPSTYVGRSAPDQTFTVVNTSSRTIYLDGMQIEGVDGDFALRGQTCNSPSTNALTPGQSCTVTIAFTPPSAGYHRGTLTLYDSGAFGWHQIPLDGYAVAGTATWTMHSESGDWVGQGLDWAFDPSTAVITADGNGAIHLHMDDGPSTNHAAWDAEFYAPAGQTLAAGTYSEAHRMGQTPNGPAMDVSGIGRGCNQSNDSFVVQDARLDKNYGWQHFAVTFEQRCDNGPALTGTIVWDSTLPNVPLIGGSDAAPFRVLQFGGELVNGALNLHWTDPAYPSVADWTVSSVRLVKGATPPGPTDGTEVYRGRDGHAVLTGLTTDSDWTVSAFTRDAYGNVSPAESLPIDHTALTLQSGSTPGVAGHAGTVTGRLTDGRSGLPFSGAVVIESRPHTGGTWTPIANVTSHADGTFAVTVRPQTSTDYRATWAGGALHLPAVSGTAALPVAPAVTVMANHASVRSGATVKFTVAATPTTPKAVVKLQRYSKGSWHTVAVGTVSNHGTATFKVKQTSRGTVSYRVHEPATHGNAAGTSKTLKVTVH